MYKKQKVLAIIPARSGSQRLKNKNILSINGLPLIAWSIKAGMSSKYIDQVIVSTDSPKIKEIAEQYGAQVPFMRPKELSTSKATSHSMLCHALDFFKNEFDIIILLQPTSPLRCSEHIDKAIEMITNGTKSIVSVCPTEHSPLWSNTLPEDLSMSNFIRTKIKDIRSQDLPNYYRLNGAIYAATIEYYRTENSFLGAHTKALIMTQEESVDIDTELDFIIAETIMKSNIVKNR